MSAIRAFDGPTSARIAKAFQPARWYGSRAHYFYARAKLRSDPLYPGIVEALRAVRAPLLDLGCGIGLLAHALRADGNPVAYRGVDNDARKIVQATRGAANAGLADATFECIDLARGLSPLRARWIAERGDTEALAGLSSEFGRKREHDPKLDAVRFGSRPLPRRAVAERLEALDSRVGENLKESAAKTAVKAAFPGARPR